MKGFKYSCFISYRRKPSVMKFVEQLSYALDRELSILLNNKPVFLDIEQMDLDSSLNNKHVFLDIEQMDSGSSLEKVIGKAIRRSACYIVVYTPNYISEEEPYSAAEFFTILAHERARVRWMTHPEQGLIFPIVLRGRDRMPEVLKTRQYLDFSSFISTGTSLSRHPFFAKQVVQLAEEIARTYRELELALPENYQDQAKHITLMKPDDPEVTQFVQQYGKEVFRPLPQF
jgi:hypothetical protein